MIALPWKKLCANFILPCGENHYGFFLRCPTSFYNRPLEIEQFICKNRDKFVTIESQGLQVDASAFYPSLEPYYNTGTIPFVRVADVKDQIEYNACVNIPEMGEEFRTLHMCYPGDVVLTKGGRVGTAGLITQPSYVTRDLIFINASALSRKDYIVLYLFFPAVLHISKWLDQVQ